jgi:long-chain alkane monooxygenase
LREKITFNKVEAITTLSREPRTLRRIMGQMGLGSRNAPIVGSADEVANELTSWSRCRRARFNLSRIVTSETLD